MTELTAALALSETHAEMFHDRHRHLNSFLDKVGWIVTVKGVPIAAQRYCDTVSYDMRINILSSGCEYRHPELFPSNHLVYSVYSLPN